MEKHPKAIKLFHEGLQKGIQPRDALFALMVSRAIEFIDYTIFPDQPVAVRIVTKKEKNGLYAGYYNPGANPEEAINIYAPGIYRWIQKDRKRNKLFGDDLSKLLEECQAISLQEAAFVIGIHEVRHRMQYKFKNSLRLFSEKSEAEDELLKKIILFKTYYMESLAKILERDGAGVEHRTERTAVEEFDAQVVESYAVHRLPQTKEELLRIMWLQPSE